MPRKMYRVASVTTRLGTRPAATMIPFAMPHSTPTPSPARNASGMGKPGAAEQARRQVRGQAQHRPHGQVVVAADDDHRLAQREQREDSGVDQDELDVVMLRNRGWMDAVTVTNSARTTMMPDSLIRKTRSVSLRAPVRRAPAARCSLCETSGRAQRSARLAALSPAPAAGLAGGGGQDLLLGGLRVRELGHQPPFPHDQDPVADPQHLGQLGGDHQHAHAVAAPAA